MEVMMVKKMENGSLKSVYIESNENQQYRKKGKYIVYSVLKKAYPINSLIEEYKKLKSRGYKVSAIFYH